ncbi:MAG TPA: phosphonate ABC transporter ATP-binding protein, partial [Polyangiaceae bacterium]|nr:phosphonate ABC transporter ATP-binding protein [Polyangiaceae bacterium]
MIRVRGLRKVYPGGTVGLDGIDLELATGEFVALIGPSGAGKSTFLRCLNGLVTPTAGEISVGGVAVTGATAHELRRVRASVGFVFQQFNLLRRLSVLENVLLGRLARVPTLRSLLALFPEADVTRAQGVLERVGLQGLGDRRVDTLSGGQQQRVAIARALVQEPQVLLADEPMASLDPALSQTVLALLRRISEEDGLTVVTSLHVLGLARLYGRRVVG